MNRPLTPEIYLDSNATVTLRPEAKEAMLHAFDVVGNPASIHRFGRRARQELETARQTIAEGLGVAVQDVLFTGSGTEANYLAVQGLRHVVSSVFVGATEHDALWANATDAAPIPVNNQGILDLEFLERHLQRVKAPALVSVMLAHNETGVTQDLAAVSNLVHAHGGWVHTDAVQAVGKIPVSFEALGVDLMTLSAHKLGGPVGIGALVVKPGIPLKPVMKGGGQEQGLRPGTQSVALAAGFAAAFEAAQASRDETAAHHRQWIQEMETQLRGICPEVEIIGGESPRLPGVSCVAMPGVTSALQVMRFDLEGIAISAGAACSSGKVTPSRALTQMGLPASVVGSAIRVSLGWHNRRQDLDQFVMCWKRIYQEVLGESIKEKRVG